MTPLLCALILLAGGPPGPGARTPPGDQGPAGPTPATAWAWVVPDSTGMFYVPRDDDFRPRHAADRGDRGRQDWTTYWNWVQVFYRGNLLSAGWTRECRRLIAQEAPDTRDRLVRRLNVLGRLIAAEWARDNRERRLDTADVRRWGRSLEAAAREGRLETVLARVEREVGERYRIPRTGASSVSSP